MIFGQSLEFVDPDEQGLLVRLLHLPNHRTEVRLQCDDWLAGANQFMDTPPKKQSQLADLLWFGGTFPLLDGDVYGSVHPRCEATSSSSHRGFLRLGNPLPDTHEGQSLQAVARLTPPSAGVLTCHEFRPRKATGFCLCRDPPPLVSVCAQ